MVCCDIGDEQSIVENLSTFSGHMHNIVDIIENITPNSLVLFDEIGGGTDPVEGANLAMAILQYLIDKNITFLVTTHYSELKTFAFNSMKIENASMEFNSNTLNPSYKLRMGIPGSSNALSIAKKLGLKDEIIESALRLDKLKDDELKNIMKILEEKTIKAEEKNKELEKLLQENKIIQDNLNKRLANIDKEKELKINKAYDKALEDIDKLKKEAITLINSLKDKSNNDVKLHELIQYQKEVNELNLVNEKEEEVEKPIHLDNYKVGDDVYVKKYDQFGVIVKVEKGNKYQVSFGNMMITLSNKDLEIKKEKKREVAKTVVVNKVNKNVSLRLDLRGMRYEEAKDVIEKYFDDLSLNNIKQCTIIHGFGTGTMRQLVQNFLQKNPLVDSYRYGVQGEGGLGVTVVNLK